MNHGSVRMKGFHGWVRTKINNLIAIDTSQRITNCLVHEVGIILTRQDN